MNTFADLDRAARQDPEDADAKTRARLEAERQGLAQHENCVVCDAVLTITGRGSDDPEQQDRCPECAWEVEAWDVGEFNRGSDGYALVIDPESRKVWARGYVGGGRSFDEMYRRVLAPELDKGLAGDQAREVVMASLDELDEIASLYDGSEFRNGNEVGLWSDLERAQALAQKIAEQVSGVGRLWSAEEWFADGVDPEAVIGNESITDYAAAQVASASGDVILDADEIEAHVREALEQHLEQADSDIEDLESEIEDEEDEEEREDIAGRLREARELAVGIRSLLGAEGA